MCIFLLAFAHLECKGPGLSLGCPVYSSIFVNLHLDGHSLPPQFPPLLLVFTHLILCMGNCTPCPFHLSDRLHFSAYWGLSAPSTPPSQSCHLSILSCPLVNSYMVVKFPPLIIIKYSIFSNLLPIGDLITQVPPWLLSFVPIPASHCIFFLLGREAIAAFSNLGLVSAVNIFSSYPYLYNRMQLMLCKKMSPNILFMWLLGVSIS